MAVIPVPLTSEGLTALEATGLRLQGLRHAGSLDAASRFEAPTSIAAPVPAGALLDIGAFCNLGGAGLNNVRFGRYGSVAAGVTIGAHEHPTDWLTTSRTAYYPAVNGWDALMTGAGAASVQARVRPYLTSCPVTEIGPDVWIGQGAFVKAGVRIGAGAVIGARATVLHDVPPYAIVVGTPARVRRLRFPEATVARLLRVTWWRYSIYDLFDAPFDRIDEALDRIEAMAAAGKITPYAPPVIGPADLAEPVRLAATLAAA